MSGRRKERKIPLKFRVESFMLYVGDDWAAQVTWDDEDGCFTLDGNGPGTYGFAPCDLIELARILRAIPRMP